jgi:hypothetical protein
MGVESEVGGAVGWWVRVAFAVHREWWTSSRPIILFTRVVELVNAFEQPAAGNRASKDHRGRGVSRFREEDPKYPKSSEVGGGGGVLACEKV